MKNFENFGKSLDRKAQKSIRGGADSATLFCNTSVNGPYSAIQVYPSHPDCYAARNSVCTPSGSYASCYCSGDTAFLSCWD